MDKDEIMQNIGKKRKRKSGKQGRASGKSSAGDNAGRWTPAEHERFLEGLRQYGRQWKFVRERVKTRTVTQVRTHAQKYFAKLAKQQRRQHMYGPTANVPLRAAGSTPLMPSIGVTTRFYPYPNYPVIQPERRIAASPSRDPMSALLKAVDVAKGELHSPVTSGSLSMAYSRDAAAVSTYRPNPKVRSVTHNHQPGAAYPFPTSSANTNTGMWRRETDIHAVASAPSAMLPNHGLSNVAALKVEALLQRLRTALWNSVGEGRDTVYGVAHIRSVENLHSRLCAGNYDRIDDVLDDISRALYIRDSSDHPAVLHIRRLIEAERLSFTEGAAAEVRPISPRSSLYGAPARSDGKLPVSAGIYRPLSGTKIEPDRAVAIRQEKAGSELEERRGNAKYPETMHMISWPQLAVPGKDSSSHTGVNQPKYRLPPLPTLNRSSRQLSKIST